LNDGWSSDEQHEVRPLKKIIAHPTSEMLSACADIDVQIEIFLEARQSVLPLGEYEAHMEADCLFKLAIRQVEGVLELARKDVVLLPPAAVAARAAYETAVKAAWLVNMDDPMDREARWLVHLASEERYLRKAVHRMGQPVRPDDSMLLRAERLRSFIEAVDREIPVGVTRLQRTPTFEQMLESIGGTARYVLYMETSQFMHAEHAATWLYRRGGVGTARNSESLSSPKTGGSRSGLRG
jgi:hypothetical protein